MRLDGDNLVDRGMRSIGLRIVSQWITIRKSLTYGSDTHRFTGLGSLPITRTYYAPGCIQNQRL